MVSPALDHLSPAWSHLTTLQPVRGEGIYLYDADGHQYIDFTSGIGVTNTGHCHPKVVEAIQKQAAQLIFGQIGTVIAPTAVQLADKLNELTPASLDSFFFANSGAEAIEGAVKLARTVTRRQNLIVFQGSFHGRTAQTMAMTTSKTIYRAGYQVLPGSVYVAPYPYSYNYGWDDDTTVDFCLAQLQLLLKSQSAPEETAAIVIEPVLGEGGYVPAPERFLRELRNVCDEYGILLVLDEVQTGFGRTGKLFAFEHAGVVPDVLVMAKGLGSGVPISAIGASRKLTEKLAPGSHGGTYGGGALATAAALASIEVIVGEDLPGNAAKMGSHLIDGLKDLQSEYPIIGDVRGKGLMIGVEFATDQHDHHVDKAVTKAVQQACLERNLLFLTCGSYENVVRWIPPLVVQQGQIDNALGIFAEALAAGTKAAHG